MTETPTSRTSPRIAELQRLAYGQAVPDAERQLALAELASLSRAHAAGARDAAATRDAVDAAAPWSAELPVIGRAASAVAVSAAGGADGRVGLVSAPDAGPPVPGAHAPDAADPSGPERTGVGAPATDPAHRRWAVTAIVGLAALVLGGVAGWQLRDAGLEAEAEEPASIFDAYAGEELATAFDDSPAGRIFARPGTDADVLPPQHREMVAHDRAGDAVDSGLVVSRLLATRSDGTTVYAAHVPGETVCVVAVLVNGASAASCPSIEQFMQRGAYAAVDGSGPSIEYALAPDGVLRVSGAD